MDGLRVGVTGARRGEETVGLLERHGARPCWGPTLEPDVAVDDARIADETRAALAGDPGWLVATTGAGLRAWLAAAERVGCAARVRAWLGRARIVARGAKAVGALRAEGCDVAFVSPNETDADLAEWLDRTVDDGETVVVQQHGNARDAGAYGGLSARVDVRTVAPYRCASPTDPAPAHALIGQACDGELDAVMATSAPAVHNLFALAAETGRAGQLRGAFAGGLAAAAVGSVTAAAFEEHGVAVTVMPHRSRTTELVRALARWADTVHGDVAGAGRAARAGQRGAAARLDPDHHAVVLAGHRVELGAREFALVAALVRRPGVVCSPQLLAREGWGHRAQGDSVQVRRELSRARRKLGPAARAIVTVRSVGYRFDPAALEGAADTVTEA